MSEVNPARATLLNASGKIFKITLPKDMGLVLFTEKNGLGANAAGIPAVSGAWSNNGKPERHGTVLFFGCPFIAEEIVPPLWWVMKERAQ